MMEHDGEPIRGLPGRLPEGERILWQGAPDWRSLARRAFLTKALAIYFAIAVVWRALAVQAETGSLAQAAFAGGVIVPLALACLGVLSLMAWATARATIYTITDRRVVLRFGVAMQMCVNVPFRQIEAAALRRLPGDRGDIALTISKEARLAYLVLWPNVRPWMFSRTEPMLRSLPNAAEPAQILAEAARAALTHDADEALASEAAPATGAIAANDDRAPTAEADFGRALPAAE